MLRPRGNIDEIKEYQHLAIYNLSTIAFKKSSCQGSSKTEDHIGKSIVEVGDKIMLRLPSHLGIIPGWIEALVEKCCEDKQCGTDNSFIITWDDKGERRSEPRLLSQDRRGVGREWCTLLDWHSFTALPLAILDALILESSFDYQTNDGSRVWGAVFKKVGAGLKYGPTWKTLGTYLDLTIGVLRNFIDISDENYARATKSLNSQELYYEKSTSMSKENISSANDFHTGGNEMACLDIPATYAGNPYNEAAHLWSMNRIKEHSLFSLSDKTRASNDLLMKKKDDGTLTYPISVKAETEEEINERSLIKVSSRQEENGPSSEEICDENEREENENILKQARSIPRRKTCVLSPSTESHNDSKIEGTRQNGKRRQEKVEVSKRRLSSSPIICTKSRIEEDEIGQIRKSRRCRQKAVPSAY